MIFNKKQRSQQQQSHHLLMMKPERDCWDTRKIGNSKASLNKRGIPLTVSTTTTIGTSKGGSSFDEEASEMEVHLLSPTRVPTHRRAAASREEAEAAPTSHRRRRQSRRKPQITSAAEPFQKSIAPTSYLQDELLKDASYVHAMKAGQIWQSLAGQHVRLPALWYDGSVSAARPYLGCPDKRNNWRYVGRHRVVNDTKLTAMVPNSESSGRLLLHIVVRDSETFEPTEDIVIGVFHPNATGIRMQSGNKSRNTNNQLETCRDVWIGHHSRRVPVNGKRKATRIESLLRYLNKSRVDGTPLGPSKEYCIDNTNINAVFGDSAPKDTLMVAEDELYDLLAPTPNTTTVKGQTRALPPVPASIVLMRKFLQTTVADI